MNGNDGWYESVAVCCECGSDEVWISTWTKVNDLSESQLDPTGMLGSEHYCPNCSDIVDVRLVDEPNDE